MTKLLYSLSCISFSLFSSIRDIFQYDTDWHHADYDIVAQGHFHETGKAFKVLNCSGQSKIITEK